jgi:hypothetical protein
LIILKTSPPWDNSHHCLKKITAVNGVKIVYVATMPSNSTRNNTKTIVWSCHEAWRRRSLHCCASCCCLSWRQIVVSCIVLVVFSCMIVVLWGSSYVLRISFSVEVIAGVVDENTPKIPQSITIATFGREDSENPAVSQNCRISWTTTLRNYCGIYGCRCSTYMICGTMFDHIARWMDTGRTSHRRMLIRTRQSKPCVLKWFLSIAKFGAHRLYKYSTAIWKACNQNLHDGNNKDMIAGVWASGFTLSYNPFYIYFIILIFMGLMTHDGVGEVLHAYGFNHLLNWMLLRLDISFKRTTKYQNAIDIVLRSSIPATVLCGLTISNPPAYLLHTWKWSWKWFQGGLVHKAVGKNGSGNGFGIPIFKCFHM